MKRHSQILERFSIKGRLEEDGLLAFGEDPAIQELLDANLLTQTFDTDGTKRYWITQSGKMYLKTEKEFYKPYNAIEAYKTLIRAEFYSFLFANPIRTMIIFIAVPILFIGILSLGISHLLIFISSFTDWFNVLLIGWADWLNENFADFS